MLLLQCLRKEVCDCLNIFRINIVGLFMKFQSVEISQACMLLRNYFRTNGKNYFRCKMDARTIARCRSGCQYMAPTVPSESGTDVAIIIASYPIRTTHQVSFPCHGNHARMRFSLTCPVTISAFSAINQRESYNLLPSVHTIIIGLY